MNLVLFHPRVSPPPPPIGPYCTHAEMVAAHKARQARFAAAGARQKQEQRAIREEARRLREWNEKAAREKKEAQRKSAELVDAFSQVKLPSICRIVAGVAKVFRVTPLDIISHRRTRGVSGEDIMTPRHVVMYLAKTTTLKSLPEIGRVLGGRDHSTILHAVRKIAARMAVDDAFKAKVEALRAAIEAKGE